MKRFTTALVAATMTSGLALLGASGASAQGYGNGGSLKDAPLPPPVCYWCGFYIGGHVGVAFSDDDNASFKKGKDFKDKWHKDLDKFFHIDDDDDDEFVGGIHLGWNWQRPGSALVLGIEGDIDFADDIDWLGSIRGRVGAGSEFALVYLTAGVAFIEGDNGFGVKFDDDKFFKGKPWLKDKIEHKWDRKGGNGDTETGWVIGGGVEFKPLQRVSFGIEALYYNFDLDGGKHDFHSKCKWEGCELKHLAHFDKDDDFDFWQIRARLSFHTGPRYEPLPPAPAPLPPLK